VVLIFILLLALLGRLIIAELERKGQDSSAREGGNCPTCAASVEADWLVCPQCGAMLEVRCSGCNGRIAAYFANCPWCGIRQKRANA